MSPSHRSGSVGIPGPIVEFALPERVFRHPQVSGQDLEWFFHQWLHLPGYPVFEVENEWIPDECGSGGTVEVTVRQVQKADWPRFGMPVELAVVSDAGIHVTQVEVSGTDRVFRIRMAHRPDRVILDPDVWVLKGGP